MARAAPVAATGGGGAVLVLHDITDLRRADQIRRDFVANVSHELRTPLTAIRGYVEALLDERRTRRTSTRRFLEIIARHSTRMERLVKDLLRLARLDARQETLDRRAVRRAADLSAASSPTWRRRSKPSGSGSPSTCHRTPRTSTADPAKLHDIVRNLVENAVNYSPDDADVRLEAARVADQFVITVSDSGPGIPADDLRARGGLEADGIQAAHLGEQLLERGHQLERALRRRRRREGCRSANPARRATSSLATGLYFIVQEPSG